MPKNFMLPSRITFDTKSSVGYGSIFGFASATAPSSGSAGASSSSGRSVRLSKRPNVTPSTAPSSSPSGFPLRLLPSMSQPSVAARNEITGTSPSPGSFLPMYTAVAPVCALANSSTRAYSGAISVDVASSSLSASSSAPGLSASSLASSAAAAAASFSASSATATSSSLNRAACFALPSSRSTYASR